MDSGEPRTAGMADRKGQDEMTLRIDPNLVLKEGMKFEREVKSVKHTLETIVSEDGSRFLLRDGAGVDHKSLSMAAKSATGWASANGYHFWNLVGADAPPGKAPKAVKVKAVSKAKAPAQTKAQTKALHKAVKGVAAKLNGRAARADGVAAMPKAHKTKGGTPALADTVNTGKRKGAA